MVCKPLIIDKFNGLAYEANDVIFDHGFNTIYEIFEKKYKNIFKINHDKFKTFCKNI